ncbi:hypothetical protein BDZ94DRAFT_1282844 [Collybia nuda]|uniref:HNH nuclease domain-containing protein n=1 Tax=Collybia nuda TaxID=64659 RepID=A0A9P5Y3B1_9AGAR|nr:hypothetical protein BDZ94DRAFT_1282844 [Collybia nuda]
MAATTHRPEIQVYASFPLVLAFGADLNLGADNWNWILCLTLPLETLGVLQFSHKPYKWIRYAIGVVIGAKGHLSSSSALLNVVDYNAGLPTEMFPIDPKIARTKVTSSVTTSRAAQFRSNVADWDGNQCVLKGTDELYYPVAGDLIHDIDSVRNGLFMNSFTHVVVGMHVAFLPTSNFAMNTADIDLTASPDEKRCTAHLFAPNYPGAFGGMRVPPFGSPLRISDTPDWPPAIVFDAVYASAVLHHFGTQILKDVIVKTWMDTYAEGIMGQAHAEFKSITNARALAEAKRQKRAQERQTRYEARAVPDTFDMLLAMPYISAMLRNAEEKAATEEQECVQEKVETWKRQVEP